MVQKWPANLDFAKRYVSEKLLKEMLSYLARNPEKNIDRLIDILRMLARQENHRQQVEAIRQSLDAYPAMRQLAEDGLKNTHPNVLQRLVCNWAINNALMGIPRQRQLSESLGFNVPNTILIDPTSACNLRCEGCWAGEYAKHDVLEPELIDRILGEAKELGIYWIVLSGGEPLLYPHLFDLMDKHNDMTFMAYTNGTLIDDKAADKIVEVGNFSPAISLEGWEEHTDRRRGNGIFRQVTSAMDRLRERGAIFGISLTATRENVEEITSDSFIDFLAEKGTRYGWIFHYIPIGRNPNPDLMLTPEQRTYMAERVPYIRTNWPLILADFWNDGELTQGCIAGGRRYFHITASGAVQPCAFVHFSTDNIRDKSLRDILQSPLFAAYQKRQPFCNDHLRPCPIIDVPAALRDIVVECGARPTHEGAETALNGEIGKFLDHRSAAWAAAVEGLRAKNSPRACQ